MPHTKPAFDALDAMVPDLQKLGVRSVLYIGWRRDTRPWWYEFSKSVGATYISVLEAFGPNVEDLRREVQKGTYDLLVYHGDVRKFDEVFKTTDPDGHLFDMIFWDHGPEHVTFDELREVTSCLVKNAGKVVLYAAPWGSWPQGADGGNDLEVHRIDLSPDNLDSLGMKVMSFGGPGQSNAGELVAWKMKV